MTSKTTKQTRTNKEKEVTQEAEAVLVQKQTDADFKNALLIVSLAVNATILVAWLAIKVTSQFDHQVASFLFYR